MLLPGMDFDPSDLELERSLGSESLREFIEMAWSHVEPAQKMVPNWHIDAICEHLEAVTRGDIKRLVINVPPGTMKSLTCSVFWPAWTWTHAPQSKWITASYSNTIARRDALRARQLMETQWFQARWGHLWRHNPDSWAAKEYRNDQGGFRFAVTVSGSVTGEHADYQLVDDSIKPLDAGTDRIETAALLKAIEWWDGTMTTRMVDVSTCRRVIIMQRLHEMDLAGHALEMGYEHLCLPMESEKPCCVQVPHRCSQSPEGTSIGFTDPRAKGELLFPARFPAEILPDRHAEMGPRGTAAQDQQRPLPAGGGTFKEEWIKYWDLMPRKGQWIQSWDCAFKDLSSSDYVVGQVWNRVGGDFYLIDQVRGQMDLPSTCKAILDMSLRWPQTRKKLIEDKANGSAVVQVLQKTVPGLVTVDPKGGKTARANAVQPFWESGNVYLPNKEHAPWVKEFEKELIGFGSMKLDDQVDSMTQALIYLHDHGAINSYKKAMRNVGGLVIRT